LEKQWFKKSGANWSTDTDDGNLAFGFHVQRRAVFADSSKSEWENFGNEIIVYKDGVKAVETVFDVARTDNWKYTVSKLVQNGYYTKQGEETPSWVSFEYRFVETNAYAKDSLENDTPTVLSYNSSEPADEAIAAGGTEILQNYPTGNLKVTKEWNTIGNAEAGAKVYVRVLRDNVDITQHIVENYADYGLYPHQVVKYEEKDGETVTQTHYAVVVSSSKNAENQVVWETVEIKGLEVSNDSAQDYKYKVEEIGFSDKNGNDNWNAADVAEILKGYEASTDGGQNYSVMSGEGVSLGGNIVVKAKNESRQKTTDFRFGKVWKDSSGDFISWQDDITVTLHQALDGNDVATATATLAPVPKGNEGDAPSTTPPKTYFKLNEVDYEVVASTDEAAQRFIFTVKNLPYSNGPDDYKEYSYYVTEQAVPGYYLFYGIYDQSNNEVNPVIDAESAGDGQYVINQQGVELPHTGGPGVQWCLLVGALLTVGASICLLAAGRKRTHDRA